MNAYKKIVKFITTVIFLIKDTLSFLQRNVFPATSLEYDLEYSLTDM